MPSFPPTCERWWWIKRQSQPVRWPSNIGSLPEPFPSDSWQARRLQDGFTDRVCRVRQKHSWIPCFPWLSTTSEPRPNSSAPDNRNAVSETLKHCLWVPLRWIPALLQCQHAATLPILSSISPKPLQSFGIVPSQSNQLDQTSPFLSQLASNWIKVWEPEFPSLSLHLYLLSHSDLSLDASPPAYSQVFWRTLFLFFFFQTQC